MHVLIAGLLVGLLAKLGVRIPAHFGGSTMRTRRHLAIIAVLATLLIVVTQVVDLGALGDSLFRALREMHGG